MGRHRQSGHRMCPEAVAAHVRNAFASRAIKDLDFLIFRGAAAEYHVGVGGRAATVGNINTCGSLTEVIMVLPPSKSTLA